MGCEVLRPLAQLAMRDRSGRGAREAAGRPRVGQVAASYVAHVVRGYRRALDAEELSRQANQQRDQSLWFHTGPDGSLVIRGRLPAEAGAMFIKALEAAEDSLPIPKNVPAGTFLDEMQGARQRRVAALGILAETLKHSHAGRCELEHGPSTAAETARRLACDASLITMVEYDQGEPLNVDGHHVKHWAHGGETKLSNLVTLCRFHHRLVHEGQVVIQTLDDGAFRFVRPDGRTYDSPAPATGDWIALVAENESADIHITASTALGRWTGEKLDCGFAVRRLTEGAKRAMSSPAREGLIDRQ